MSSRPLVLVLSLSLLFAPILTQASTCSELANTINNDIKNHHDDLAKQNFPWKNVVWLKKKLGKALPTNPASGQVQYHWDCAEEEDSAITLLMNTATKLTEIKGRYNQGEEGAGIFSACINCEPAPAPTSVAEAKPETDSKVLETQTVAETAYSPLPHGLSGPGTPVQTTAVPG
jgi:hypothetical protein